MKKWGLEVRENKLDAKMEGCAKIRVAKNTMSENWYDAKFEVSKVCVCVCVCLCARVCV